MKNIKFIIMLLGVVIISCNNPPQNHSISSDENSNNEYKPGYGEIMLNIQARHIKLWYAGINKNWSLADFSIHEIEEAVEKIQKYHLEKEETKHIAMMVPSIEALEKSIKDEDIDSFESQFEALTVSCNTCHQLTNHEFIQIKVPDFNPYSNQMFSKVEVVPLKTQ